jgi:glyoxylase-like metal-dependent hydrolase (beta-lactamase superfamily II)
MEVAPGVHRLGSSYVNWYVVIDGDAVSAVDAGLPGQWGQLTALLGRLGRTLSDIEAVVLTHAHVDHIGVAERVRRGASARVLVHEGDARDGTRILPPPQLFLMPTSWRYLAHATAERLALTPALGERETFTDGATLDIPGHPRVLHTPGHTAGSCLLHLEDRGVLFTGDTLVTFDPYTGRRGPRQLFKGANENQAQARASLERIAGVHADLLLPGHGEPWSQGSAAAVARARTA